MNTDEKCSSYVGFLMCMNRKYESVHKVCAKVEFVLKNANMATKQIFVV
jgi:hypothetical protein